jgi:tRNA (guanine37-N1)-methyltransferase
MNISILTVFSELYKPFMETSLIKKAQEQDLVHIDVDRFFSFVPPKKRIDAPTFGPGAGMLIRPEVVQDAIASKEQAYGKAYKVFFSPSGDKLDQRMLRKIADSARKAGHLMLLPARYEGMDDRVEQEYADVTVSVGDFVLMGGDIPAMMLLEGLMRLVPGVVGKEESVLRDSFTGPFVDHPEYTEPVEWQGKTVPDIVRSGNHGAIEQWRMQKAAQKTVLHHFDWMRRQLMTSDQIAVAKKYVPPHYVALAHGDVLIGDERGVGTTSVTTIDLHDISRSSKTYGIEQFFAVTPLLDQQKVIRRLLDFWHSDKGIAYNQNRHSAVQLLSVQDTIDDAIKAIEAKEGKKPIVISTSAIEGAGQKLISYHDQAIVWQHNRPVLLVFGTGRGLTPEFVAACDYQLMPLYGFTDFRHLSVRSAAATILDRWLGLNPYCK